MWRNMFDLSPGLGFVHEFRPLDATEMQELLQQRWTPIGVTLPLPDELFAPESWPG